MNTETQSPATDPGVAPPVAAAGEIEIKVKSAMAGRNFSWRPGQVVTVPAEQAASMIRKGQAARATDEDKAAAVEQGRAKIVSDDNRKRAEQAESKARGAIQAAEKAELEAKGLGLEVKRLDVNVEQLEKDNKTLSNRCVVQEGEIGKLNTAAEGLRNAAEDAAEDKRRAEDALQTTQGGLDQAREKLTTAEAAIAAANAAIEKLKGEVANRDKQIEAFQKKAASKRTA